MNRGLQTAIFLAVAAVAGIAGYYFSHTSFGSAASQAAARRLLRAPLAGLDGKKQTLVHQEGKILVVNFWATWCPPCREEIPELIRVHSKYVSNGVELVGIAIDNVDKVKAYAMEMRIDYGLLIAGAETLAMSKDLGNEGGVLPFTIVLDRTRRVVYTHAGALTEAALDAVLLPLLQ
ncbi:MAG: TlpA disulfide reductase family protein [Burkholderiales bacterium]